MFGPADIWEAEVQRQAAQAEEEASYLESVSPVYKRARKAVLRLERRLGRKISREQGQVVANNLCLLDPQEIAPRFFRCPNCGGWGDRGTIAERAHSRLDCCAWCAIPF
jgi:hypothetical protein